ncbi:DNA repair protein RAD51 homolog 3 [Rhagoletis pomonella]|uniref:DNA repair protein RAD51 homolog 3 n=1 Tax=Rhagoletis pomonella TaxID=28610 RepID=UPI00177E93C7|nr:DNA repair protein RAD51 homolog 3 [Rhagoletis pomonella]
MFKTTCFDIWRQEKEMPRLITLCKELDDKLAGGIVAGLITEFCGGPGCGKTQMCLQLCINVQFPRTVGGLQGKAVYLDTNQDFSPTRLLEMAVCTEKRFHRTLHKTDIHTHAQNSFTANSIMNGVTYIYCQGFLMLQAAVKKLHEMLMEDKEIKLIVIDSFSFPLRVIEEVSERTGILYTLLSELQHLAVEYKLIVSRSRFLFWSLNN